MNYKYLILTFLIIAAMGGAALISEGFDRPPEEAEEGQELQDANIYTGNWFDLNDAQLDLEEDAPEDERPDFWPEELESRGQFKDKDSGNTDCAISNYKFDINEPMGDNIGNLRDAQINCKMKLLKK